MNNLCITMLSDDEIRKMNNLDGILDENYETDLFKIYRRNDGNILSRTYNISGSSRVDGSFASLYNWQYNIKSKKLEHSDIAWYSELGLFDKKIKIYESSLGHLLPVLKLSEVEQKLNINIDDMYIELFSYPMSVSNKQEQEYIKAGLDNGEVIKTNIKIIDDNVVYFDKRTNKKYLCIYCEYNQFNKNYINRYGQVILNDNIICDNSSKLLFIECSPIKFYVSRELNYLIPTKLFLPDINIFNSQKEYFNNFIDNMESSYFFFRTNYYKYLKNNFLSDISKLNKLKYYDEFILDLNNLDEFLKFDLNFIIINNLIINNADKLSLKQICSIFNKVSRSIKNITICLNKNNLLFKSKYILNCPFGIRLSFNDNLILNNNDTKINGECYKDSKFYENEIDNLIKEIEEIIKKLDNKSIMENKLNDIVNDYNNQMDLIKSRLIPNEIIITEKPSDILSLNLYTYLKLLSFKKKLLKRPNLLNILSIIDYFTSNNCNFKCSNNKMFLYIKNTFDILNSLDDDNKNSLKNDVIDILNKYKEKINDELNCLVNKEVNLVLESIDYEEEVLRELNNIWIKYPNILLKCQLLNCISILKNNNTYQIIGIDNNGIQNIVMEIKTLINDYYDNNDEIINNIISLLNLNKYKLDDIRIKLIEIKFNLSNRQDAIKDTYGKRKLILNL